MTCREICWKQPGQQYDQTSGQYYLRARFYNPVLGRFVQEDVYRGDGLNLYAYCKNNPVVYYDPSGYGEEKCDKVGGNDSKSGSKATGTYGDLVSSGQKDAHHIIQDAAVRDISGYNRMDAPAIQLDGPSNVVGTEHYYATITQRKNGGGTYGAERGIAYMSLRKAGLSVDDAKAAVRGADDYFMGQLGLTLDSPTRTPGNRRQ